MTVTKSNSKPRITAAQRKDWRNLPYEHWNTATIHAYFADMNRELFGIDGYLPMRNYGFEQGLIKRALTEHGAEVLRHAFDECFRTYKPTRDYPILTAGFAISYRINGLIPRIKAELREVVAEKSEQSRIGNADYSELTDWI